jgi:hypothetical protein
MTVYEAASAEHYRKITQFLQSHPEGSFVFSCFQQLKGTYVEEFFSNLKKEYPILEIVVCEDSDGAIHVVGGNQIIQGMKTSFTVFNFMLETDYQAGNTQYYKEMVLWMCKNDYEKYGVTSHLSNFLNNANYLKFLQEIFGDHIKVIKTNEIDFSDGTHYQTRIDVKGFLEIKDDNK